MAQTTKKPDEIKRIYRSKTDRQLAGVCGGIAEYFNVDPTLVRLGAVVVILLSGVFPGVIAYIIAALIIPEKGQSGPIL